MSSRSCACRCSLCLCSSCLRVGVRILLVGACSDSLSLRPVYDIEKISVVGLFHIALYDIVEEICGSCSVNELDGEVLVACERIYHVLALAVLLNEVFGFDDNIVVHKTDLRSLVYYSLTP